MTCDNDFHICKVSSSPGARDSFEKWQAEATEGEFDRVRRRSNLRFWRQYRGVFKWVFSGVRIPGFEKLLKPPKPQLLYLQCGNHFCTYIMIVPSLCQLTGALHMLAIIRFLLSHNLSCIVFALLWERWASNRKRRGDYICKKFTFWLGIE